MFRQFALHKIKKGTELAPLSYIWFNFQFQYETLPYIPSLYGIKISTLQGHPQHKDGEQRNRCGNFKHTTKNFPTWHKRSVFPSTHKIPPFLLFQHTL